MSDLDKVLERVLAHNSAGRVVELPGNRRGVIVPEDYRLEVSSDPDEKTGHIVASPALYDLPSFLAYFQRYAEQATTVIFANQKDRRVTAIFDYHSAEAQESNWNHHHATLPLATSPDWDAWAGIDGRWQGQKEFAEFLEERVHTIHAPASAAVLESVADLKSTTTVDFQSKINVNNGQVVFKYSEAGAGDTVKVPARLKLALPVFDVDDEAELVDVMLRYRIASEARDGAKGLQFMIKRDRPERAVKSAFNALVTKVNEGTGYVALLGTASVGRY